MSIAQRVTLGRGALIGVGEEAPNVWKPQIYGFGLATIGEQSEIPEDVRVGKNTVIFGKTVPEDYVDGELPSGGALVKEVDEVR